MASKDGLIAADLFCGCGSVSHALSHAGFEIAFAVDNDEAAVNTYTANHPKTRVFHEDIRSVTIEDAARCLNGQQLDLLAICAPCQPFSSQNRRRGGHDDRTSLIIEAMRFVEALRPATVWIENVPGLGRSQEAVHLQTQLRSQGFGFNGPLRIDAAKLGVPQRRVRYIFVASRDDEVVERAERLRQCGVARPPKTVRDAFTGLRRIEAGEKDPEDPLHFGRKHSEITVKRLNAIPRDGGSRSSLPAALQLKCHARLPDSSFPDVYGRMSWNLAAPTLTTGCCDVTRGRFAHPDLSRAITLREAARLQTFPDDFQFTGSAKDISRLIGNAVPFEMACLIFRWLFLKEWPLPCDLGATFKEGQPRHVSDLRPLVH